MKFRLILLLTIFILSSQINGRSKDSNSGYLSLQGGNYLILSDNYKKLYGGRPAFVFGSSIGISITSRFLIQGTASYFQKSAEYIPNDNYELQENNLLKQLIFDIGLEFNVFPKSIVNLFLQGGYSIAVIDEERKNIEGDFTFQIEGTGNSGAYGGAHLDINFLKSPVALFANYKYYFSKNPILKFDKTYRAQKLSFGIRLYFSERW